MMLLEDVLGSDEFSDPVSFFYWQRRRGVNTGSWRIQILSAEYLVFSKSKILWPQKSKTVLIGQINKTYEITD